MRSSMPCKRISILVGEPGHGVGAALGALQVDFRRSAERAAGDERPENAASGDTWQRRHRIPLLETGYTACKRVVR